MSKNFKTLIIGLGALVAIIFAAKELSIFNQGDSTNSSSQTAAVVNSAPTSGLVGYWKFDEGSGSTSADASGNSSNVLVGNATWVSSGKSGTALGFNGSSQATVSGFNKIASYPFTISAWSRATVGDNGSYRPIVSLYAGTSQYFAIGWATPRGIPVLAARNTTFYSSAARVATLNTWTNVTAVFTSPTDRKLYVDGVLVASDQINSINFISPTQIIIGGGFDDVDEVRIYSSALTATEVTDIYNDSSTASLPPPSQTSSPDTTPPTISAVSSSSITQSSANISWTTNELADTQVEYGVTTGYGSASPLNTSAVTSHRVSLSGLAANTVYHYRVKSKDAANNPSISQDFTFTTPLQSQTNVAPVISSFTASPSTITIIGGSTSLSWSVSGTPSPTLSINNSVGSVTGASKSVSPTITTTYTLTATNSAGSATKQVTVAVNTVASMSSALSPVVIPPPPPVATFAPGTYRAVVEDFACGDIVAASNTNPVVLTCNNNHNFVNISKWYVDISGATGAWSGINGFKQATRVSANQFSIPVSSATFGSFSTQSGVKVRRMNGGQQNFAGQDVSGATGNVTDQINPAGTLQINVPQCDPAMDEVTCSLGYWSPENQKGYMVRQSISNIVVQNGVTTVNFTAPFVDNASYEPLAVGQLVWIRGMQGIDATMAKGGTRGYRVQSMDPGKKWVTLTTSLPNGTYIPTCLPSGNCIVNQQNGFLAITFRANSYVYVTARTGSGHTYPNGYLFSHVKYGNFNPESNRIRYWVKWGDDSEMPPNGAYNYNMGTYPQNQGDVSSHFYHYLTINTHKDAWQLFEFNCAPSHQVGAAGATFWPNQATEGHIFYPQFSGGPRNCMEAMTILYLDTEGYKDSYGTRAGVQQLGPIEFDYVVNEPEELVRGRGGMFSQNRFINRTLTNSPGYEIFWESGTGLSGLSYEVRYSTTGSLKTGGFSSGRSGGNVTGPGMPTYGGNIWTSPQMSEQPGFWVGIRPKVQVESIADNNNGEVWVMSRADMNFAVGDKVNIDNFGGGANLTNKLVTQVAPRQRWFRFQPQIPRPWTVPSDLNSIDASLGQCTVSLNVPHNLTLNWKFLVTGSTDKALGALSSTPGGKAYLVNKIIDAKTFGFACPGVPNGTYNTDLDPSYVHLAIETFPAFAIQTSMPATASGGTMYSTEEYKNFAEVYLYPYTINPAVIPPVVTPPVTNPPVTTIAPSISSFFASPSSITAGLSSLLSWIVSGTPIPTLSINQGIGSVTGPTRSVSPSQTTTYTLTATNSAGVATKQASITVTPPVVIPPVVGDVTPPIISNIRIPKLGYSAAAIAWNTDEVSDSKVEYGLTSSYSTSTPLNLNMTLLHGSTLRNLQPGRTYHYRVISKDSSGNTAFSTDQTFTTLGRLAKPPKLFNIRVTPGSVILDWDPIDYDLCTNIVIYRSTTSYPTNSGSPLATLACDATTYHDSAVTPSTTYYYSLYVIDDLNVYSDPLNVSYTTPADSTASSGGGGGGSSSGTPRTSSGTTASTNVSVTTTTTTTIQNPSGSISKNLSFRSEGPDVTLLQKFLVAQKFLTADNVTGFFGPVTEAALKRFQIQFGIVSSGSVETTGFGAAGPKTRGVINSLLGNTVSSATTPATTPPPAPLSGQITKRLVRKSEGAEVSLLQKILVQEGFLTGDSVTGYFGPVTEAALKKFQAAHYLVTSGTPTTTGFGATGPLTRDLLNTLVK